MFVDTSNGNYHLQPCSPLINAGNNAFVDFSDTTDISNAPRIQGGTVDIGAYETPVPNLTSSPTITPACHNVPNGSASLQIENGCAPYQVTWANGANTGQGLSALPAGDYVLTITDARGSSFTSFLTIPEGSSLSLIPQSTPLVCGDTLGGSATAQVSGGPAPFVFNWQGSTDSVYANLAPGNYPLTVTDALGCTATGSVSVVKTGNLGIDVQATAISCYGAADGSFTITPQNGKAPFQWQWENGPNSPAYGPLAPGTYNGTLTDAFGCNIIWVLPLSQPDSIYFEAIVTPASDSTIGNGSIQLNPITGGTQPYTAHWSNGQNLLAIHNLKPGSYSVTLTDHNGCTKTAVYLVPLVVGTSEAESASSFSIFPNPADQVIHFKGEKQASRSWITISNALGQQIMTTQTFDGSLDVDVINWPEGWYCLAAFDAKQGLRVLRFIVHH